MGQLYPTKVDVETVFKIIQDAYNQNRNSKSTCATDNRSIAVAVRTKNGNISTSSTEHNTNTNTELDIDKDNNCIESENDVQQMDIDDNTPRDKDGIENCVKDLTKKELKKIKKREKYLKELSHASKVVEKENDDKGTECEVKKKKKSSKSETKSFDVEAEENNKHLKSDNKSIEKKSKRHKIHEIVDETNRSNQTELSPG